MAVGFRKCNDWQIHALFKESHFTQTVNQSKFIPKKIAHSALAAPRETSQKETQASISLRHQRAGLELLHFMRISPRWAAVAVRKSHKLFPGNPLSCVSADCNGNRQRQQTSTTLFLRVGLGLVPVAKRGQTAQGHKTT